MYIDISHNSVLLTAYQKCKCQIASFAQDCGKFIADALELLHLCTKASMCYDICNIYEMTCWRNFDTVNAC